MTDRYTRLAGWVGTVIPDAQTTAVGLMVLVAVAAPLLGTSVGQALDAYYRGLWMLLPFTMQMVLILVLSASLSEAAVFRRLVTRLAGVPRSRQGVLALAILLVAALSYVYWGLGFCMGPLVAIHFARHAERRGVPIDFPFLLATTAAATSVWQFGLSSSAPLLMNTPGHFLEATVGRMPLSTTIFAPASLAFVAIFPVALWGAACALMPRRPSPISVFPDAERLADTAETVPAPSEESTDAVPGTPSERLERHPLPTLLLAAALVAWLYQHFVVKGAGLDLNSMVTTILLACVVAHRNVRNFSASLRRAVVVTWPVVVLYHLYAGVAGLIQFTTVGERLAGASAAVSTPLTFPLLTALTASVVSVFVPSSGGQWVIQGFVTSKTAAALGVEAQRGLLALSVGDHVGNLLSPFWVVVAAGIARVDFRCFIGYNVAFALLWFVLGVIVFTVLPV